MLKKDNINNKAFHELILYYLRERITGNNIEVKHLIATNIYEWYIFDSRDFDKLFAQHKHFIKQFTDFEEKRLANTDTSFFYKEIAEKFVNLLETEISFTYFDIRDYEKPLRNLDKKDDNVLIALYKLLSPQHLLKQAFLNDSNSLDKTFYSELLHIIGLEETKDGSKKLIGRKSANRNNGSFIENTIIQLDTLDKITRLANPSQYGSNTNEKLYNVSLELVITWINRILFLKLLEAQLVSYHKGDKNYNFLNTEKIKDFDELNSLFFRVLARKPDERSEDVAKLFATVPYLNSSLFEPTELEHQTIFISGLRNEFKVPIIPNTVLKDNSGKKRCGELNPLEYIFEFLNAYDFSSEGSEEIQEENKTLINASVLGLIFEKINGYKDGSFFTPGFITMYMCRETIRRAVLQKFNQTFPLPGGGQGVGQVSMSWKSKIIPYRTDLPEKARNLRNNPTVSERILWEALKGKSQFGYDFHRQKPIDRFITDFYCRNLNLVIELDGESHLSDDVVEKDKIKEIALNHLGLNILRFPDALVINNTSQVLKQIEIYIESFTKKDSALYRDVCTPDLSYKTALNPLSENGFVFSSSGNSEGIGNTPPDPLSRGGDENFALSGGGGEERYKSLNDLYEAVGTDFSKPEANRIINSLKICDPAVGSGHFLVSALNEIIAIKSELKILCDSNGKTLRDYAIEVVNDELAISDEDGKPFEYNPNNPENRRVQETLFHEKQTIIENCLFGVDINPNSVKICRLRLWIELLKNAYYKAPDFKELETLPNIDINIKCGNSLISRYALDSDIKTALKKSKWTIDSYRLAVMTYRNAQSKDEKRAMVKLIDEIKNDFESEVAINDKRKIRLRKLKAELLNHTTQTSLFEKSKSEKAAWNKLVNKLTTEAQKLETEIEEIKNNKIYENAFEWRFEFPEVLNDDGDFVGFDVVIGNPPYGRYLDLSEAFKTSLLDSELSAGTGDIAESFIRLAINKLFNINGIFSFIVPKGLSYVKSWEPIRNIFLNKLNLIEIIDTSKSFKEAAYEMMIFFIDQKENDYVFTGTLNEKSVNKFSIKKTFFSNDIFYFGFPLEYLSILEKVNVKSMPVSKYFECWYGKGGLTPYINKICDGIKVLTGKEIQRYYQKDIPDKWYVNSELINDDLNDRINIVKVVAQDIVAHIQNPKPHIKLTATIDYSNQFCLNTVMCFSSKSELNNEFLLGLINSSFLSFYYYYFVFNQAIRTMHFMPGYSDTLPIPDNASYFNNNISSIVLEILKIKKSDPTVDTTSLEKEIDRMVYELYGLTEEEIKIVEGK